MLYDGWHFASLPDLLTCSVSHDDGQHFADLAQHFAHLHFSLRCIVQFFTTGACCSKDIYFY